MIETKGSELAKLEVVAFGLLERAKAIVVDGPRSLERAHKELVYIKGVRRQINDFCDPNINRLHVAHKESLAQKRVFERGAKEAENHLNPQIASYLRKQEEIRRAAEREAERAREEAEKRAKEEEDARLEKALAAQEEGRLEEAEKILDQEPVQDTLPEIVIPPKEKVRGLYVRKDWYWEPEDKEDFEGIPREWMRLVPYKERIDSYVKEMKEKAKIEGIRIFSKDITIQRSG